MPHLTVEPVPCLRDNYAWIAYDREDGVCAIVDPSEAEPVREALRVLGLKPTHILNTHHHADHVGGNLELKEAFSLTVVGPGKDAERIPGIDVGVVEGDVYNLGRHAARVFEIPAHTRGHIAFWFAEDDALFPGDTLFAMGCGRLFEGDPPTMWNSLSKLAKLPDATRVYCAHEYTESNGRFALSIEPHNTALQARMEAVLATRAKGLPTLPSNMGDEKRTNPFLRAASKEIRETLGLEHAPDVEVFAEARRRKDVFKG